MVMLGKAEPSPLLKRENHTQPLNHSETEKSAFVFPKELQLLVLSVSGSEEILSPAVYYSFIHSMIFFLTEYLLGTVRHQCQANAEIVSALRELAI